MIISRATTEDAPEILALQRLAYQSEAEIYNDYSIEPLTQALEELERDLEEYLYLKAVVRDRIIGSVRGRIQGDACEVGRLIVDPEYQSQGIGSKLMKEIEVSFSDAHIFQIFTGHKSKRNIILYQKLGYKISEIEPLNDNLRLMHMTKQVQAAALPMAGDSPSI